MRNGVAGAATAAGGAAPGRPPSALQALRLGIERRPAAGLQGDQVGPRGARKLSSNCTLS